MPFWVFSQLNFSQTCTSVNFEIWIYLYRYFWLEPLFEVGKLEVAGDVLLFSTVTWKTVVWACQTGSVWCLLSLCTSILPAWKLSKLFKWSYFEEKSWFYDERKKCKWFNTKECFEGSLLCLYLVSFKHLLCACRWSRWVSCPLLWIHWCSTIDRLFRSWRNFLKI